MSGRLITYRGETKSVAEWAAETGMSKKTIMSRLNRGWDSERILSEPASHSQRSGHPWKKYNRTFHAIA